MNPFWTVSLFWIATVVCVVVALAFVLPALLRTRVAAGTAARRDVNIAVYRDQLKELEGDRANGLIPEDQFQITKLELEARLADDALGVDAAREPARESNRTFGYVLGAILPVAAFGLYFWLGNPTSLIEIAAAPTRSEPKLNPNAPMREHDIQKMVQQAEAKVKDNPKDGDAWAILAKTYAAMGRWPEAWKSYQFAIDLLPENAALLSGQAEALAVLNGRVLQGRPMELVNRALQLDPNDIKGLELAGFNAFQEKNFAQAATYLQNLHRQLPPEAPFAKNILAAINEAQRLAAGGAPANLAEQGAPAAAPASNVTIRGSLEITPELKARLAQNDVIFLFARPIQGGPPVAAVRGPAIRLPMDFELSDRLAMNPDNLLSQHKEVVLVARVSKSGGPMAQPGDLEGSVSGVKVGASGVTIVIDKLVP
ncbi:MAG: c-type cytochrome biogenesis protein CcmI [Burkholderiaceae bacterium]|nr:c-type cytochrome biogenesis protein CcmI [Burkholderiaceae bacterium]